MFGVTVPIEMVGVGNDTVRERVGSNEIVVLASLEKLEVPGVPVRSSVSETDIEAEGVGVGGGVIVGVLVLVMDGSAL